MNKREWMLQAAFAAIRGDQVAWGDIGATTAYLGGLYDAIVAATPDPVNTDWIEHHGEKPYPEGLVDVKFRDGRTLERVDSDNLIWSHGDFAVPEEDIIAWRPARA